MYPIETLKNDYSVSVCYMLGIIKKQEGGFHLITSVIPGTRVK